MKKIWVLGALLVPLFLYAAETREARAIRLLRAYWNINHSDTAYDLVDRSSSTVLRESADKEDEREKLESEIVEFFAEVEPTPVPTPVILGVKVDEETSGCLVSKYEPLMDSKSVTLTGIVTVTQAGKISMFVDEKTGCSVLEVYKDGDVFYKGKKLGTNREIYRGLCDAFDGRDSRRIIKKLDASLSEAVSMEGRLLDRGNELQRALEECTGDLKTCTDTIERGHR